VEGAAIAAIVALVVIVGLGYALFTRAGSGIERRADPEETIEEAESGEPSGRDPDDTVFDQRGTE
jgi:hypothetical protein